MSIHEHGQERFINGQPLDHTLFSSDIEIREYFSVPKGEIYEQASSEYDDEFGLFANNEVIYLRHIVEKDAHVELSHPTPSIKLSINTSDDGAEVHMFYMDRGNLIGRATYDLDGGITSISNSGIPLASQIPPEAAEDFREALLRSEDFEEFVRNWGRAERLNILTRTVAEFRVSDQQFLFYTDASAKENEDPAKVEDFTVGSPNKYWDDSYLVKEVENNLVLVREGAGGLVEKISAPRYINGIDKIGDNQDNNWMRIQFMQEFGYTYNDGTK